MIRKLMASSAVIALVSAGAIGIAQAQTDPAKPAIVQDNAAAVPDNSAAPDTQLVDSKQAITPDQPTLASTIIGKSVYSSNDPESDNIGDVNDLIVAEDGSVTHAVIGVGGFLGIGEKNVAVPFDELKVVEDNGDLRLVYSATKEQLQAAPAFDRTAYDPAARAAPQTSDTAANDTTGMTPPVAATSGDVAAAPPPTDDQTAASGSTAATSDQMAASDTTAKTDPNAKTTAPAAQDFVQTAAVANQFEIESSRVALDHAQNEDVKNFAQRMIDDHTKAGDDLKAAVRSANADINVPDALDQAHKDKLDQLQAANTDFDRQYVDMQVKAHDDAVNLFQGYADNGDNDQIKQFAANTLPTLKDHQKMIHDISDNLGSGANTAMTTESAQPTTSEQPANATANATASDNSMPAGDMAFISASGDQVRANWLIGKGVYGPDNQNIGEVHDLVLQKDTGVRVALIDVGGFLGIGEKTVAIPFTDLQYKKVDNSNEPQVTVAMSKEDLKNQPAYDTNQLDEAAAANAPAATPAATTDNTMANNGVTTDQTAPAVNAPATADNTVANNGVTPDQTAPATTNQMATNNNSVEVTTGSVPPSQDMAATSLIGTTVYGSDDSSIGEVGDIVFDKKGDIDAIIVDVGGFLGMGEKPVALSFDQLNVRSDQSGNLTLVANATKDQLNNAPAFETTARQ
jgi:predicted outer membrane protein/sporulation protein YlmC with PRC-barrel domain